MEFHFIKLNVNGTYLTLVDPMSKPRYICFSEHAEARVCINYVSLFRSKYGIWPCFDMSKRRRKLERDTRVKQRTPEQVMQYLDIETYDLKTIDRLHVEQMHLSTVYYVSKVIILEILNPSQCLVKRWMQLSTISRIEIC